MTAPPSRHAGPLQHRSRAPFAARIPGSKAATHRALVLAPMRRGTTEVVGSTGKLDRIVIDRNRDAIHEAVERYVAGGRVVARATDADGRFERTEQWRVEGRREVWNDTDADGATFTIVLFDTAGKELRRQRSDRLGLVGTR